MPRWWLVPLVLVSVPLAAAESSFAPARSPEDLTRRIAGLMARYDVPGLSMVVINRDGTELVEGLGLADLASRRPATAQPLCRLGSTSKLFVGLSVLELVEEGRLSLDARVRSGPPTSSPSTPKERKRSRPSTGRSGPTSALARPRR